MKEMKEIKETMSVLNNKNMIKTMNDAVNMAENIPSSLSTETLVVGITVAVLAGGACAAYSFSQWRKKPSCFSDADIIRHRSLIGSYEKMGINRPDFWSLTDDNRPIFKMDYLTIKSEIDRKIDVLEEHPSTINFSRTSILSLLSRYLESVDKRAEIVDKMTSSYERDDGVEAMFLSEMISWLLTKFLELPDIGENSMETIEKRLKYCREIHLLLSRNNIRDKNRANFKDMLENVCHELSCYHGNLINQSKMVNYNSLVTSLNDKLLDYESALFNMLYLLTKGAYQARLNVNKFKNPATSDVKDISMRNTVLGDWLFKTLSIAGIDTATFDSTNELTIKQINEHLQGQHPNDKNCELKSELRNVKSDTWGHWDFVTEEMSPSADKTTLTTTETPGKSKGSFFNKNKQSSSLTNQAINVRTEHKDDSSHHQRQPLLSSVLDESQRANVSSHQATDIHKRSYNIAMYLNSIREIHRLTLLIGHLRKKIDRSKFVTGVFGQAWIYGDPTGKAALDELLFSVAHDIELCEMTINAFWDAYFNHYKEYAQKKRVDSVKYPCHVWLNKINTRGIRRQKIVESISTLVESIKINSNALPITLAKANQALQTLYHDILLHMEFYGRTRNDNYRIIKQALDRLQQEKPSVLLLNDPKQQVVENLLPNCTTDSFKRNSAILEVESDIDISPKLDSSSLVKTNTKTQIETIRHSDYANFNSALQVNLLEYKKSALQFYFKVDELLDFNRPIADSNPLKSLINYDLVPKSTNFRSNEIKDIYSDYLVKNHYEVTSYWLAVFTFSSKISAAKINLFRETYLRINAVFNLLYDPSRTENPPMDIEIILAETLLRAAIENDFWNNKYFACYPFRTAPLLMVEDKNDGSETLQVTLDKKWFNLGEGLLREEINHLKTVVHDQDRKLAAVTQDRDELKIQLKDKDIDLTNTKSELTNTKSELLLVKQQRDLLSAGEARSHTMSGR